MSEGPISQARRAWLPPKTSTNPKTAKHLTEHLGGLPLCGYRKPTAETNDPTRATCANCLAAYNADRTIGASDEWDETEPDLALRSSQQPGGDPTS
jgi:hypothetical protein